jgi:Type I phosphodiesterase / nucleotide pyrophosphatase
VSLAAGVEPDGAALPAVTGALADVLPAAAASLGVGRPPSGLALPPAARVCVLLVDGLGERLLAARGGHAPTLRALLPDGAVLACGFPSTTATSMATFGTGLPAGGHGLVGYQVRDPATGRLLNELSWDGGPDPRQWQPEPTVLEMVAAAGVDVVRVGPAFFDGSGLTEAALRGGRFVAAGSLDERVDAAVAALRRSRRSLVYVYWGDLDKAGHVHGARSWQWGEELAEVDLAVRRLAGGMPADTLLLVTADHGMVDVPEDARTDVAGDAELAAGVVMTGGEPRAPMLYCAPGAADDVLATWRGRLGDVLDVRSGDEAVAAGWFGPVVPRVRPRIGDVVAAARAAVSVHDSRWQRPELATLVGMHGALTPEEVRVPLLQVRGRRVG